MQLRGFAWWTLLGLLLLQACIVEGQTFCGNGIRNIGEDCDDGNNVDGDGCTNCSIDDQFTCNGNNTNCLIDLNVPNNRTVDYSSELFMFDQHSIIFLSDPNMTDMTSFYAPTDWDSITLLLLEYDNGSEIGAADVYSNEAYQEGRLSQDYTGLVTRSFVNLGIEYPDGFKGRNVVLGMTVTGNPMSPLGDGNSQLNVTEIDNVLRSWGYTSHGQHPGYTPRDVCIMANAGSFSTTACVTLSFVGFNDDAPTVSYSPAGIAEFVEGQSPAVFVVMGNLIVDDDDHPTRYPMQGANVSVVGFSAGAQETLSLSYVPPGFTQTFDNTTGVLTITGTATAVEYSAILLNITYHNNMSEPLGNSRTIRLRVFDGIEYSNDQDIEVSLVNVNDNPAVSLFGEVPIVRMLNVTYMEGSGAQTILPNVVVIDTDPTAMIQRVTISLMNPPNGNEEFIDIVDNNGLTVVNVSQHQLTVMGSAVPGTYTAALRTLTYENRNANPGNPSTAPRFIYFMAEDDQNATSSFSIALLELMPVNDAPILLYVPNQDTLAQPERVITTGANTTRFNYTEDDSPVNFGADIYLRDVDSQIESAIIQLAGLLNGPQDQVSYDDLLVGAYSITVNETSGNSGQSREIVFEGIASPEIYEQILQSLSYQNNFTNNSVTDGQRNITIITRDSEQWYSEEIYAYITVMDRNDGPFIDLGGGRDMDMTTIFVENGMSVALGLTHLASIMDEEGHNIYSINAELVSTNGVLDAGDILFPQSPHILPFIDHPNTIASRTRFYVRGNFTTQQFTQALTSLRFVSDEEEPTIFTMPGVNLTREVIITVVDVNGSPTVVRVSIVIEPINDNAPRIRLVTEPASCSEDHMSIGVAPARKRRDVKLGKKQRRKRAAESYLNKVSDTMTPKILEAYANVSSDHCLTSIHLTFNTATSVPPIDRQRDLELLLYFDPPELNWTPHRGFWESYSKMRVTFDECIILERVMGRGHDHTVFVVFDAKRESCDYSTTCNRGLCFGNSTGCPLSGYYPVTTAVNVTSGDNQPTPHEDDYIFYHASIVTIVLLALATPLLLLAVKCWGPNNRKPLPSTDSSISKPVTTLGAQSVTIDIAPTKTTGAPPDVKIAKIEKVPLEGTVSPTKSSSKPSQSSSQTATTKAERVRASSPTKKGPPPAYEDSWQSPQESQERELVSLTLEEEEDVGDRDREKGDPGKLDGHQWKPMCTCSVQDLERGAENRSHSSSCRSRTLLGHSSNTNSSNSRALARQQTPHNTPH